MTIAKGVNEGVIGKRNLRKTLKCKKFLIIYKAMAIWD
jgi:hypothetical protein